MIEENFKFLKEYFWVIGTCLVSGGVASLYNYAWALILSGAILITLSLWIKNKNEKIPKKKLNRTKNKSF